MPKTTKTNSKKTSAKTTAKKPKTQEVGTMDVATRKVNSPKTGNRPTIVGDTNTVQDPMVSSSQPASKKPAPVVAAEKDAELYQDDNNGYSDMLDQIIEDDRKKKLNLPPKEQIEKESAAKVETAGKIVLPPKNADVGDIDMNLPEDATTQPGKPKKWGKRVVIFIVLVILGLVVFNFLLDAEIINASVQPLTDIL